MRLGQRVAASHSILRNSVPDTDRSSLTAAVIFERFIGGESPDEIAADFGRTLEEVHEAIRCENTATAAA
jgi:hypothetical protein